MSNLDEKNIILLSCFNIVLQYLPKIVRQNRLSVTLHREQIICRQ